MTLQFQPPTPNRRPTMADYSQQWGQSLNGLGDTFMQAAQTRQQLERQAMLDKLLAAKEGREQQQFAYDYQDPLVRPNPIDAGPRMVTEQQPQGSSIVAAHRLSLGSPKPQAAPMQSMFRGAGNNTDPYDGMSPEMRAYSSLPGAKNREAYAAAYGKFGNPEENAADIRLKKAQARWYEDRPAGGDKRFYFVDPASKQMYDENMMPIDVAPIGATPRTISNPANSTESTKRSGLVRGARQSIQTARGLLTDQVLNEIKGIKMTPGRIYSQLASSEAKKFYRNLSNAIANELYIKSGATATPNEIEAKMIMYMPAYNDGLPDVEDRLSMLDGEVSLFDAGGNSPAPARNQGGLMWQGRPLKDTPANRAWLQQQQGGGQ